MLVNRANLDLLFTGYKTAFTGGMQTAQAASQWSLVASEIPSANSEELYPWLQMIPGMREWIGDRYIHNLAAETYRLVNKDYEQTIAVDKNYIQDDRYGVFTPMFSMMGQAAEAHVDQNVWPALAAGFAATCFDGQYFFDTDHPVIQEDGTVASVANTDGGSGTAWFMFDSRMPLKPILFQNRQNPEFAAMDQANDEQVFNTRTFRYGTHARRAFGYGFWQTCWGSKQTLNQTNYRVGREAMASLKGDHGRPLGVMLDTLVVPPSLEGEALEIVNAERNAAGATNVYKGTAKAVVVPWLA